MKKKKIKVKRKFKIILAIFLLMGIVILILYIINNMQKFKNRMIDVYLASDTIDVPLYDIKYEEVLKLKRGTKVKYLINQKIEGYKKVIYDKVEYLLKDNNASDNIKDVVLEKTIYVRTSYNLYKDSKSSALSVLCKKGDELEIIGYDYLLDDGNVNMYEVKTKKGETGYFYQKYSSITYEDSIKNYYDINTNYKVHSTRGNPYGGGNAISLDYYPVTKPVFENNVMPKSVYALYLNCGNNIINNVDNFINYAKTTKINTFIVDIKDNESSGYDSLVMKKYSKTSYDKKINSFNNYKNAIKKIKDAGFYVVGRITTFKDTYYINDNMDKAIANSSGDPLKHQKSYWPTPYSRDVWEYNVELAKEAVTEMGFNEIQFDYVRFPDGLRSSEKAGTVNYKNTYNETKAEAIQRFLMYATNELHKLNVYVSCDVFGESTWGYVTGYGQYWPAMSNIVDVISAMPYTDHFGNNYGGHSNPWEYPYDTMLTWSKTAKQRQNETPSQAIARTWITAYNTPYWKPTVTYNGDNVSLQIKALYDAGLNGGYMTWNSASNLDKYINQKSAYTKEYYNEAN